MALSLSKPGYFEWAFFQGNLIAAIKAWEQTHALDDPSWDYYECWLTALETTILESNLATASELSTAFTALDGASHAGAECQQSWRVIRVTDQRCCKARGRSRNEGERSRWCVGNLRGDRRDAAPVTGWRTTAGERTKCGGPL